MAKTRRTFTREFKVEAVRRIDEQGKSLAEVARELDLGESMLRGWRQALSAEGDRAFPGKGCQPALEEELRRLRAEVKRLQAERDILKKADRPGVWGGESLGMGGDGDETRGGPRITIGEARTTRR